MKRIPKVILFCNIICKCIIYHHLVAIFDQKKQKRNCFFLVNYNYNEENKNKLKKILRTMLPFKFYIIVIFFYMYMFVFTVVLLRFYLFPLLFFLVLTIFLCFCLQFNSQAISNQFNLVFSLNVFFSFQFLKQ